jgi:hypothetical protein
MYVHPGLANIRKNTKFGQVHEQVVSAMMQSTVGNELDKS